MKLKFIILFTILVTRAFCQTANIPLENIRLPADDLVYQGEILSEMEAWALSHEKSGALDLSSLNPQDSSLWENIDSPKLDGKLDHIEIFDNETTSYLGSLKSNEGVFRFNVLDSSNELQTIYLDKTLHTTLLRKNLLRKLGYKIPAIKYLPTLQVSFKTKSEKDAFIEKMRWGAVGSTKRWIDEEKSTELILSLRDVSATELSDEKLYNLAMGTPLGALKSRTMRALVVPYSLLNLGESINRYNISLGKIKKKVLHLDHPNKFNDFSSTTMNDVEWITDRLKDLSRMDFENIVKYSYFPVAVQKILVEKIIKRRNSLLKLLKIKHKKIKANTRISYHNELSKGKVIKSNWREEGYATEFAGQRSVSPFDDFGYYILATLQSEVMSKITEYTNKYLSLGKYFDQFSPDAKKLKLAQKQFEEGLNTFVETGEIMQFPVSAWISPIAKGNIVLSRDVIIGNYLGTDNLIQLADSFGYAGTLGAIVGLENIKTNPWTNNTVNGFPDFNYLSGTRLGINATYSKIFTHIRPLTTLKDVFKENYKNLAIPLLKRNLTKYLSRVQKKVQENDDFLDDEETRDPFLDKVYQQITTLLGVGESLIITEKFSPGASAATTVPLFGSGFSLALGANGKKEYIRRLQFLRRDTNTIQIFDDGGNKLTLGFSAELHNIVPLIRFANSSNRGKYTVNQYSVNIDSDLKKNPNFFRNLNLFNTTFKSGKTEIIEDVLTPNKIEGRFKDRHLKFGALIWRKKINTGFSEYMVNAMNGLTGNYYSYHNSNRGGINPVSFAKDVLHFGLFKIANGLVKRQERIQTENVDNGGEFDQSKVDSANKSAKFLKQIILSDNPYKNPSETFGGHAKITQVTYEAQREEEVDVLSYMNIKTQYKGWSKNKKKLLRIVRRVNRFHAVEIFREEELDDIKKLKLYDIMVDVNIYNEGIKRLKNIDDDHLIRLAYHVEKDTLDKCKPEYRTTNYLSTGQAIPSCGYLTNAIHLNFKCRQNRENYKKTAKCLTKLTKQLYKSLSFEMFTQVVGGDNLFLTGQINGFRHKSEILNDPILSNEYGRPDERFPLGILDEVKRRLGMQNGEFHGFWIRERY